MGRLPGDRAVRGNTRSTAGLGGSSPVGFAGFVTFNLIVLGWILFRSTDLTVFGDYMSALVRSGPATLYSVPVVGAIFAGGRPYSSCPSARWRASSCGSAGCGPLLLGAALAVVVLIGRSDRAQPRACPPFIYFRF